MQIKSKNIKYIIIYNNFKIYLSLNISINYEKENHEKTYLGDCSGNIISNVL